MSALQIGPQQTPRPTIFNITSGGTPSGIDLLVSGALVNASSSADTGIYLQGNGTMALTGTNTYAGVTVMDPGATLEINGAGELGGGLYAGDITNNGTMDYDSSASQTFTGIMTGSGVLNVQGPGTLTTTGTNTATGASRSTGASWSSRPTARAWGVSPWPAAR